MRYLATVLWLIAWPFMKDVFDLQSGFQKVLFWAFYVIVFLVFISENS